jgi:hypothetical protein
MKSPAQIAPLLLYIAGSLCFLLGSLISLLKALR